MTGTEAAPALGGRKAEAERNDRAVLAAARDVFFELGYDAPMSAIAERAGVGMGSLYRRYRSKDDLIRRLCKVSMEGILRAAEEALEKEPDGWSALTRFMRASANCGAGSLGQFAGAFPVTEELVELSTRGATAMQAILDRARREGTLRVGVTPGDLALIFQLLRVQLSSDRTRTTQLRDRYLTVLLDGLRRRDAELPGPPPGWPEIQDRWGPATD
jgi:AcrR family transcriptional regulator